MHASCISYAHLYPGATVAIAGSDLVGGGKGLLKRGATSNFGSVELRTAPYLRSLSIHFHLSSASPLHPIQNKQQKCLNVNSSSGEQSARSGIAKLTDRGNFKMNGSLASVKKIVDDLNSADFDGKTGECGVGIGSDSWLTP